MVGNQCHTFENYGSGPKHIGSSQVKRFDIVYYSNGDLPSLWVLFYMRCPLIQGLVLLCNVHHSYQTVHSLYQAMIHLASCPLFPMQPVNMEKKYKKSKTVHALRCVMPLSTIFQPYRGSQFY